MAKSPSIMTGWWFQPLWKNESPLGLFFPIYGKNKKWYIEFPIEIPTFVHSKSRHGHGATQCSRGALPLALALPSALAATTPLLSHADHLARSWRLRSHFRGAFEQLLFIVNAQKNGKKEVTSCIYIYICICIYIYMIYVCVCMYIYIYIKNTVLQNI